MMQTPVTVIVGIIAGLFMAPAGQTAWRAALAYYDQARPVVAMSARLVSFEDGTARVAMSGEKIRPCTYLRMQAYTRSSDGALSDAYTRRDDRRERGDSKLPGTYDIGTWSVWPASGAVAVIMVVQHDCDGRIVQSKIADVALPGSATP